MYMILYMVIVVGFGFFAQSYTYAGVDNKELNKLNLIENCAQLYCKTSTGNCRTNPMKLGCRSHPTGGCHNTCNDDPIVI